MVSPEDNGFSSPDSFRVGGRTTVSSSSSPLRRILSFFRSFGAGESSSGHGQDESESDPFAVGGSGLVPEESSNERSNDAEDGGEITDEDRRLSQQVSALLDLTSRASRNLRAAERGWDWDIFSVEEKDDDSTLTMDADIARKQARAELAEMLQISSREAARKRKRSEEE